MEQEQAGSPWDILHALYFEITLQNDLAKFMRRKSGKEMNFGGALLVLVLVRYAFILSDDGFAHKSWMAWRNKLSRGCEFISRLQQHDNLRALCVQWLEESVWEQEVEVGMRKMKSIIFGI